MKATPYAIRASATAEVSPETEAKTSLRFSARKRAESNTEFVSRLMEFSGRGALAQLVILTAVSKYVEQVVANEAKVVAGMGAGLISGEGWVAACRDLRREFAARGIANL